MTLTRRQQQIYDYLVENLNHFSTPPTIAALCQALGLRSRGSLHKHIQALVEAELIEPLDHKHRGIRLRSNEESEQGIPYLGLIAAGQPIEALPQPEFMQVPLSFLTEKPCYLLKVRGDSMIEAGILDGDFVIIEQAEQASSGKIVVALIKQENATLKRIEYQDDTVLLHPANAQMQTQIYPAREVEIQGILVGQMRRYLH